MKKKRWDNLRNGEELLGLCITEFPELKQIEDEITMLDRLYTCVDPPKLCLQLLACKAEVPSTCLCTRQGYKWCC